MCDPCCGSGGFLIRAFEYGREKIENDIQRTKNRLKKQFLGDAFESMPDKQKERVSQQLGAVIEDNNRSVCVEPRSVAILTGTYEIPAKKEK